MPVADCGPHIPPSITSAAGSTDLIPSAALCSRAAYLRGSTRGAKYFGEFCSFQICQTSIGWATVQPHGGPPWGGGWVGRRGLPRGGVGLGRAERVEDVAGIDSRARPELASRPVAFHGGGCEISERRSRRGVLRRIHRAVATRAGASVHVCGPLR